MGEEDGKETAPKEQSGAACSWAYIKEVYDCHLSTEVLQDGELSKGTMIMIVFLEPTCPLAYFLLYRKFLRISYITKYYAQLRARNKSCAAGLFGCESFVLSQEIRRSFLREKVEIK